MIISTPIYNAALRALYPTAHTWGRDEQVPPNVVARDQDNTPIVINITDLEQEATRLQTLYNALEYQRLRAPAYPSVLDQLDTMYHHGYDAWHATIQTIKERYPKVTV